MRPDSFKPRSRFTLIELLTVVAILAILIAMLFPSLHLAKRKAVMLGCVVNMKYQGLCYQSYISDYDSQFPRSWYSNGHKWKMGGQVLTWPRLENLNNSLMLNSYAGVDESYIDYNHTNSVKYHGSIYSNNPAYYQPNGPYIESKPGTNSGDGRQIFNCPGDIGQTNGTGNDNPNVLVEYLDGTGAWEGTGDKWGTTTTWERFGSRSYLYNDLGNGNVPGNGYGLQYIQTQEVQSASYTVMSVCNSANGAYASGMGNNPDAPEIPHQYTYWHTDALSEGPALFVDGHVRSIKLYKNTGVYDSARQSPATYGKVNVDPAKWADFNFCFRDMLVGDTYVYKNMNWQDGAGGPY